MLFRASAVGSHTTLSRIIRMVRRPRAASRRLASLLTKSRPFCAGSGRHCAAERGDLVFLRPGTADCLHLGHRHYGADHRLSVRSWLATPMSIISGVGRAAELGVLVRDADALQRASTLDTIVFDKTGTLTEGKPQVVAVSTAGIAQEDALRLAAALEQGSSHPLARAILDKANASALPQVSNFRTLRGLGVSGEADGHALLLGNRHC